MPTLAIDLDGYTDLPPGKIANVVTYLQRKPEATPSAPHPRFSVRTLTRPDPVAYRALFQRVGENWLWFPSRLDDAALATALAAPAVALLVVEDTSGPVGFAKLAFAADAASCEILGFGVVAEVIGTGAAHLLMEATLSATAARKVERLWLHTCTFDHPAAIAFYLRHGFRAWKFAIEVFDDPRLTGVLPRSAAPHVPLIEPER